MAADTKVRVEAFVKHSMEKAAALASDKLEQALLYGTASVRIDHDGSIWMTDGATGEMREWTFEESQARHEANKRAVLAMVARLTGGKGEA